MNKSTADFYILNPCFEFFSSTSQVQESLLLHIALFPFIACSSQATLASGWEQKRWGGGETIMCRMHLLLSECSLTSSPLSGSRLKLNQKWTGKICWSAKRYPADQEMVASFLPSYHFSWRVNRTTAGDREGTLAANVPDWKVMNSVKCENTFPFVENKSRAVIFMKNHTRLPQFQHVFHSLRHHKWGFHYGASFLYMWPCIRRGITRTHNPFMLPSWWQHFPAFDSQNCFRRTWLHLLANAKKGKMVRNAEKLQKLLELNSSVWCKG